MTAVIGAVAVLVAALAVVVLARRRLLLVTVVGASMEPTLADGSRLLVRRGHSVNRGDLVVFRPPREPMPGDPVLLVKRVAAVSGDDIPPWVAAATRSVDDVVPSGSLVVRGDALRSEDSSTWGPISSGRVVGRVLRQVS